LTETTAALQVSATASVRTLAHTLGCALSTQVRVIEHEDSEASQTDMTL
jgi:hypothetical protein